MLTLSAIQEAILAQAATQPTYLVDINWGGGIQRWSTRGDHTVGGIAYTGGQIGVRGAANWRTASIALVPTAEHAATLALGDWIGASCVVSLYPIKYHPQIIEAGYVEASYGYIGTETGATITLIDGVLSAGEYSGNGPITLSVRHWATVGRWAPRTRLSPPICNHLPAPGTTFTWAGEVYVLEAREGGRA